MNKIPQVAPKTIALATDLDVMYGAQQWSGNDLSRLRIKWDVFERYMIIPKLENFPREM
ncbi:hypothetical protein B0T24DRAFT_683628 [Lasiosphaeria ovina]|uniref:Uncharacterized protein n=1 Tax=Lasiosphaeria ovina TaxID=92902 RepID=A0AAE0JWE8_9PEZI|nr:hypothetical protein B0T24DRAFT_683628 [Lasiosphaeria ovina]